MYEHEAESDEDCEVYFLKPVNEYNIVEKIKEANKELFADDEEQDVKTAATTPQIDESAGNRKVTFALNLEDYEPTTTASNAEPATNVDNDDVINDLELKFKCTELLQCTTIVEETQSEEEALVAADADAEVAIQQPSESTMELSVENAELQEQEMVVKENEFEDEEAEEVQSILEEDEEEEISEEIIVTDMECEKEQVEHITTTAQRRMSKQITFDYDEEDNKSMTNLLPSSDCEYEPDETQNNATASDNELADPLNSTLEEDDDEDMVDNENNDNDDFDDDISMIVAAYMPKELVKAEVTTTEVEQKAKQLKSKPSTTLSKPSHFFSALRRKAKLSASPQLSSESDLTLQSVSDLKLNYKTCCEYRNAMQEKLPKYTGYLSEYGLSREQLISREEQQMRKHHFALEQTLKSNEVEMRKMQDNERAFTSWLKNKMRYPINKTRNMFDVKLRRNTMVGTSYNGSAHECNGSTRFK